MSQHWDAAFYNQSHRYVWQLAAGDLLPLLNAQPGERILDAGCGAGQLTARLAEAAGAPTVLGVDHSPAMIAEASAAYPHLRFASADLAADGALPGAPFDAVFSNAVLHWVRDAPAAARNLAAALRPGGGRLVAEFGGLHNVNAVCAAAAQSGAGDHPWYFPSLAAYCGVLAEAGLEVRAAWHFPRPTRMENSGSGLRDWLRMFGAHWLNRIEPAQREDWFCRMEALARPALWNREDGQWYIDYWRLRVVAVKP